MNGHVFENIVFDANTPTDAAFVAGKEVAVEVDARTNAAETAVAQRSAIAALNEQALIAVAEIAVPNFPAIVLPTWVFRYGIRQGFCVAIQHEREFIRGLNDGGTERRTGLLVEEVQHVALQRRHVRILMQRDVPTRDFLNATPQAVEIDQVIGGVQHCAANERTTALHAAAEEAIGALPVTGAGSRAEVAILPQMSATSAELAHTAFRNVIAHADELHAFGVHHADGGRRRVQQAEAVPDLQRARIAIRANPRRIAIRAQQLRLLCEMHPVTPRLLTGLHTAKRQSCRTAMLQGIQRRTEGTVCIERMSVPFVASISIRLPASSSCVIRPSMQPRGSRSSVAPSSER